MGFALAAVLLLLPQWELLGSRRVSFAVERDAIVVGPGEGTFDAIRIEVDGGSLEMYDIRLTFGNGDTWSPNTRVLFREGSGSRLIDLPGARLIRKIEFWYRSRLRRGQATVRVFGRTAAAPLGQPPLAQPTAAAPTTAENPLPGPTSDWDHIGMRPVDFRLDHDAISGAGDGAFRAIRIDVEGGDLEMFDVKVTFGNGETFSPATRLYFREGTRSRVIDLPGAARLIRRVDFFYRSAPFGAQGRAIVHVYGRR
jgi:hypothetical protein